MSSAFGSRHSSVGVPLGMRMNGEAITRLPLGSTDPLDSIQVTAIVPPGEAEENDVRGNGYLYTRDIDISSDVTVNQKDAWLIHGKRYETRLIHNADSGLRKLTVVRRESISTTSDARNRSER